MDRRFDPRSIVTPYAFAVHPDLLGRPLATPWQRLGAIVVDLIVIGFISQIGAAPLAIASTVLLFWLAFRKPGRDVLGKIFRVAVGCLGFVILSITVLVVLWNLYGDQLEEFLEESGSGIQIETTGDIAGAGGEREDEGPVRLVDLGRGFLGVAALQGAATAEEAQALMGNLARAAMDAGLSRGEIRDILKGIIPEEAAWAPSGEELIDRAIADLTGVGETPVGAPTDQTAADTEVESAVQAVPFSPAAVDSIERLEREIRLAEEDKVDLEDRLERTRAELAEERDKGLLPWFSSLIEDLGLGSIWAAFYLTITHAWWRGTSVGKRLFRIRVVMIDKRPLNWWLAFERVGGYAAGFATGLLGFAQVFWDPNRQAIHDKVSETIVIQDGRAPVPGPWIEEGKAQWARGRHGAQETSGG